MEDESGAKPTVDTNSATFSGAQEAKETSTPQVDQPQHKSETADAPAVNQAEVPCHQNFLQEVDPECQPVKDQSPRSEQEKN